ncbi:hypothetical protein PSECIP111951_00427 [Pseudoalteromonas holothuriae]|uniref:DUF2141 domain-containing protein n=1 Tax=Pseudoalteromonas holothuriae TaxID=2963714 RepID=A0A9W4VMA4_9GAMM|nr:MULTISPECIES: DUF2141 domain-containing protein [unclassified Pseudoalteromonas]CAH9049675.1 hypothetical protein PSECIP111854_00322 [Pseudoalteromonas sp. CIP111854]CAH9051605.1 hypothetical protein PSECIP111951_00427 [Pseudoalteromonas sp. CIP111951]
MLIRATAFTLMLSPVMAVANPIAASEGVLEVVVNSAKNNDGEIQVALMNKAAQFDSKEPPVAVCRQIVDKQKALCKFEKLQHGEYAIFAYHDENKNKELDENFLGAPTEKLAISGVDLAQNQSPTFVQSKFKFNSQLAQVFINLQ